MGSLSTRGWVCMCQSVSLLGTAVGDVTPVHSPTLQTLHALIAFPAHASSRHSVALLSPTPLPPPSLVSSHALFRSHVCLPLSSLLSFTDTWAHWFAAWMVQRSLSGYPAVWPWSVQARRRLECERGSMERGSKAQMMYESLSGKMGGQNGYRLARTVQQSLKSNLSDHSSHRNRSVASSRWNSTESYLYLQFTQLHCMHYCSSHLSLLVNVTAVKVKLAPALHLHDCCSPLKCKTAFQIEAYQSVTVSECWCNMTWPAHLIYDDFTQMHFIIRDTGKLSKMSLWPTTRKPRVLVWHLWFILSRMMTEHWTSMLIDFRHRLITVILIYLCEVTLLVILEIEERKHMEYSQTCFRKGSKASFSQRGRRFKLESTT